MVIGSYWWPCTAECNVSIFTKPGECQKWNDSDLGPKGPPFSNCSEATGLPWYDHDGYVSYLELQINGHFKFKKIIVFQGQFSILSAFSIEKLKNMAFLLQFAVPTLCCVFNFSSTFNISHCISDIMLGITAQPSQRQNRHASEERILRRARNALAVCILPEQYGSRKARGAASSDVVSE